MSQLTFAEAEYEGKTRREKFLERMDKLIPWEKLERQLSKKYSTGKTSRKPYPLPVILRIHVMQLIYNLNDPAMEDTLYEIESIRRFAGLRMSDNLPDETTILNFRHFLEKHMFGQRLFDTIQGHLSSQGLKSSKKAVSWMRPLLQRPLRPKMKRVSATLRCIKSRKAMNGTLA
ncbi:hypothetical protein GCM10027217_27820 [Pseudomaricurvus hydrocarbonicus]